MLLLHMGDSRNTLNALLFIPDISGFTEFVHFTEIKHSKHIISELLEVLLDANIMDLQLAEIEGDALFFYKEQNGVNISELEEQIKQMYIAFHTHLKRYEYERICQCGACSSAYNLSLKFVCHYGEIDFIKVKETLKPYGSSVIQAHRLLKNEIPINEYALYTDKVSQIDKLETAMKASFDFGNIVFKYQALEVFKSELPYVPPIPNEVPKHKLFTFTKTLEIPILDLYETISNFDYRLLWVKGVDQLDYQKDQINKKGIKHKCLIDRSKEVSQTTVTKETGPNQYVYGESTTEVPFMKRFNVYYVLEETKRGSTQLIAECYADFKPLGVLMKPILVKKLKNNIEEAINELILLFKSGFSLNNQISENENNQ